MEKKIAIIVGTRPDILKLSPVIRFCSKNSIPFLLIHSGQHYDVSMDGIFFEELGLPKPDINLESHKEFDADVFLDQTGVMMNKFKRVFMEELVDIVIVLGDTNTALAASIMARRLALQLAHVEAGLRSFDWRMQEEHNRVMIDHISNFKFAPTQNAVSNLLREGIPKHTIFLTGNTVVDAVNQNLDIAFKKSKIIDKLKLRKQFILVTAHRAENVDDPRRLKSMMDGLFKISDQLPYTILFPIHPRTVRKMKEFDIQPPRKIIFIDPPGYLDFLVLEHSASLIMTDSGGIQEEACILKKPCVTMRETTERPETLNIGCNMLSGIDSESILNAARVMLNKQIFYKNPFGDGKASARIISTLIKPVVLPNIK